MDEYLPHTPILANAPKPEDSEIGPWTCSYENREENPMRDVYAEFLEVHRSSSGSKKVVVRVSEFNYGAIALGSCVLLDKVQITQLRDRLNQYLACFESENAFEFAIAYLEATINEEHIEWAERVGGACVYLSSFTMMRADSEQVEDLGKRLISCGWDPKNRSPHSSTLEVYNCWKACLITPEKS